MTIVDKINYLEERIETTGSYNYHTWLEGEIDEKTLNKLIILYFKDWRINHQDNNPDDKVIGLRGYDVNSGLLYFGLCYSIVKKLESEGKL